MTTTEAAESLGVTPTCIRLQVERGIIHAVKHGRDWHIVPREVERYRRERLGKHGPKSK